MWSPRSRYRRVIVYLLLAAVTLWQGAPLLANTSLALAAPSPTERLSAYSPSYLLLNNFANETALIITGVPVLNGNMEGLPPQSLSVENIYINSLELPLNITIHEAYSNSSWLNLNNTVTVEGKWGYGLIALPPYTNDLLLLVKPRLSLYVNLSLKEGATYHAIRAGFLAINSTSTTFICSNMTVASTPSRELVLEAPANTTDYLIVATSNCSKISVNELLTINDQRVSEWLGRSKPAPSTLTENEAAIYYLSLLVLKDDQNPYDGLFAASPSPIYLYSWVRDSSFAAMALQASGHLNSAAKYWLWLALNASWMAPGAWYTRYGFYTGAPDESFGIPEYDGEALFEIGVYQFYEMTRNVSFLYTVLPALAKVVEFQVQSINRSPYHLMPEDLSVWEERLSYHFWTQALTAIGLEYASELLETAGNTTLANEALEASVLLNESIQKYFWNGSTYCSSLVPVVLYTSEGSVRLLNVQPPCVDSATLLPIALYPEYWGLRGELDVIFTNRTLWNNKVGGLPRFHGDTYHYTSYLYDSSGPSPPWIITTLFLALYYAQQHNYTEALKLIAWASAHTQHGLLPEAVDPNYGNPLPSTSPLTWSAAMYVMVVDDLREISASSPYQVITGVAVIVVAIVILYVLRKRFNVLTS